MRKSIAEYPIKVYKNRDTYIDTWTIRTLHSSGALDILRQEFDRSPLDAVALQEVRWPGEWSQKYGGTETADPGTGFLFRDRIFSDFKYIRFVSDSISYAILNIRLNNYKCAQSY